MASGQGAHGEGSGTTASGLFSHTEGLGTTASEEASHAEGLDTAASGEASHAEGLNTTAGGEASHAEGFQTTASGLFSHAEGVNTTASAEASHAEGLGTTADGLFSHAGGLNTNTGGLAGAFIIGQSATAAYTYSFHLGNGLAVGPTLNAVILDNAGNARLDGTVISPAAADYAEMFETIDGNSMEAGHFVTLEGKKIRKAHSSDDYILGVTSATPAMIADASDLRWHKLYLTDKWGRVKYHEVHVPEQRDGKGNVTLPEMKKTEPILNPEYDSSQKYVSRMLRPEWVPVGLLGKLLVRDDGTCEVDGYCCPNNDGIATASDTGYRVMERIGSNQIRVLVHATFQKTSVHMSRVEQLERLSKLKEQGMITENEFEFEKQRILHV